MKQYVKLFEDFITEEDPLADLLGGEEEGKDKKKEDDPLDKEKKKQKEKEVKAEKKHQENIDNKEDHIDGILKKMPDVDEKIGDKVRDAIKSQDRVKIHNMVLDLTYMQQKYQEEGNQDMIIRLTPLKDIFDDLDRSFTSSKRI